MHTLESGFWQQLVFLKNDFESVQFSQYPFLKQIKETLMQEGASFAQMTGSGSAIYALVDSQKEQFELKEKIEKKLNNCKNSKNFKIELFGF